MRVVEGTCAKLSKDEKKSDFQLHINFFMCIFERIYRHGPLCSLTLCVISAKSWLISHVFAMPNMQIIENNGFEGQSALSVSQGQIIRLFFFELPTLNCCVLCIKYK